MDIVEPTVIYEDNQGAIIWVTNGIRNAKHVAVRRNFVKKEADRETVAIKYCPIEDVTADILAKHLLRVNFEKHRQELGVLAPTMQRTRAGV